jgi:hypothetical protein
VVAEHQLLLLPLLLHLPLLKRLLLPTLLLLPLLRPEAGQLLVVHPHLQRSLLHLVADLLLLRKLLLKRLHLPLQRSLLLLPDQHLVALPPRRPPLLLPRRLLLLLHAAPPGHVHKYSIKKWKNSISVFNYFFLWFLLSVERKSKRTNSKPPYPSVFLF